MHINQLADIIDVIRDSVEIIDIMKPVYNFKASDKKNSCIVIQKTGIFGQSLSKIFL